MYRRPHQTMKQLGIILWVICAGFLQGCDNDDFTEEEKMDKRITVTFDGDSERIYPWMSFSAYTKNRETLYAVVGSDTMTMNDGLFRIGKGEMGEIHQITLLSRQKGSDWIDVSVTYRKRMDSPSSSDDLKIDMKGYVNNVLRLDTVNIMHAFDKDYKPSAKEYIYTIFF